MHQKPQVRRGKCIKKGQILADGAEGSPADHDEGFPGRPHDTSVLTSFADHVAYSIWSGEVILFFIFCCVVCDNECLINFYVLLFNSGMT